MKEQEFLLFSVITQLNALIAVILQLNGIISTWLAFQNLAWNQIACHATSRRSYYLDKLKKSKLKRLQRKKRKLWFKPGRTDLWWQNLVNGEAMDECWRKNFRLTREEFDDLVKQLEPQISSGNSPSPNYRALSLEKKVAITLYYLKDTGSLNMTANAF